MRVVRNEVESPGVAKLNKKIEDKSARVGIIGLGYVGLPLAATIAEAGFHAQGFDVQRNRVELVNQGINYIGDVVGSKMKKLVAGGFLQATSDLGELRNVEIIVICVPTPLDKHLQPDLRYIINSTKQVANNISEGTLVILESTTYPGTTEEVLLPILEGRWQDVPELLREFQETGPLTREMSCGRDFFLAYSPERVDPGNQEFKTENTPKVVGGITEDCARLAAQFYLAVLKADVWRVTSPRVAEMEKLMENIFRLVNIGLVNEMAILCKKMNIDIWEVIEAAKTKPYGFMPFYPGPGLGGHCIPIDPFYLTYKAKEFGLETRLIEVAGEINRQMPKYVVDQCMHILNFSQIAVKGARVLLTGIAYKADIDDWRESPALEIMERLIILGAIVDYHDPYIPSIKIKSISHKSLELTPERVEQADLILITTDHSNIDYKVICEQAKRILDTRNIIFRMGMLPVNGEYYKI